MGDTEPLNLSVQYMASTESLTTSLCSQVKTCNGSYNENPDTLIYETTYLLIHLFTGGLATLAISLFGVLGNAINCFVFYRQGLRDRMNLCLFALALADFCFVLCSAMYSLVIVLFAFHVQDIGEKEYVKTVAYCSGVIFACRTTSGLYLMVIAVERCVCVVFPFRASSLIRTRTMGILLSTIALICQLGFIGQSLKYNVVEIKFGGRSRWQLTPTILWLDNRVLIDTVVYVIFEISVPLIIFLIVSLATVITVIKLSSAMAWRQKTSSSGTDQNERQVALTKTLVLASSVYILSMTPLVLTKAVRVFVEDFSAYGAHSRYYGIYSSLASEDVRGTCYHVVVPEALS
ncbi:uncharacterized protein LOC112566915 [Pomacea canaliculata]|uniref:uncharacterized protein LOC112566915 n=1 Tax=Pomacea canaliculata TaxID=400727 RepID=UPI000D72BD30|nr:uncharacterized protein LOC112566915 [Pomacea canaliculata]